MKRRHFFEFEDLPWFPGFLRNYLTDFLRTVAEKFNMFGPVVPILHEWVRRSQINTLVDLASGGGGQWQTFIPQIREKYPTFHVHLTDKYPNLPALRKVQQAFPEHVEIETASVDAARVPRQLMGARTLFLSLHHFKPDCAIRIFEDAVSANTPIAVFEAQQRDLAHLIRFSFSPLMSWILTPFIRPFSSGRLLFTYLIPLVPFVIFWDGVVSVLRTYTLEEMEEMARAADPENAFIWKSEKMTHGQQTLLVFMGYPKTSI
ncbi:hypothetical protein P0Y35_01880 [Kiritimatiellaeota bacterium B1221]|nr:hypothetical protein [Kiritimatiellaeota bacterium B1221]